MPSMRDGRPVNADRSPVQLGVEDRVLRVDDAQPRRVLHQARVAADRRARPAGAGPDHDPRRDGVLLQRHLAEDRLGDVVVAAPVRRALGVGELVEEVPVALGREPLRLGDDRRRVVDEVARAALRLDQRDLLGAGRGRHHRDERQAEEAGEVRLGDGGRAARGLDDRRAARRSSRCTGRRGTASARGGASAIPSGGPTRPSGRGRSPIRGQRERVQVRVGRAVGVRLDATDRLVRPLPRARALTTVRGRRHSRSLPDPEVPRGPDAAVLQVDRSASPPSPLEKMW